MLKNWSFWCSIITTIATIFALIISCSQIALSNKQSLFDRRLKAYMLVQGLIVLCKEYLDEILMEERTSKPVYSIDSIFAGMTNNSYMESQADAIKHPLQVPFHQNFLRKREELRSLAMEFEFIFKGPEVSSYSNFIRAYENTLAAMYRYKIVIDNMEKENQKSPKNEEALSNICGEKPIRQKLYGALDNLKTAYDAITQSKAEGKIKQQITLKCKQRAPLCSRSSIALRHPARSRVSCHLPYNTPAEPGPPAHSPTAPSCP